VKAKRPGHTSHKPAGEIDVLSHVAHMQNTLEQCRKRLIFRHSFATAEMFEKIIVDVGCVCLHLTLHGDEKNLLFLEHPVSIGSGEAMHEKRIKETFQKAIGGRPPSLVIVLSKHASPGAKLMEKCGIEHVVMIRYEYAERDLAVRFFQDLFYQYILNASTVEESFHEALHKTKQRYSGLRLTRKFELMGIAEDHNVVIFPNLPDSSGKFKYIDRTDMQGNYKLPLPVLNFEGRNESVFKVLQNVVLSREAKEERTPIITWVHGVEGFGKTGVVSMAAHYLKDRKFFDQILYVDCLEVSDETDLSMVVEKALTRNENERDESENLYQTVDQLQLQSALTKQHQQLTHGPFLKDAMKWRGRIFKFEHLKNCINSSFRKPWLLILDSLLRKPTESWKQVLRFCKNLLENCPTVRLMCCSRVFDIEQIQHYFREDVIVRSVLIQPMSDQAALRLLLHSRPQNLVEQEFKFRKQTEIMSDLRQHPIGLLASEHNVPLAIHKLCNIMNEYKQGFYTCTPEMLHHMIRELEPFHMYLHRSSRHQTQEWKEIRRQSKLPPKTRAMSHHCRELLKKYEILLKSYREKQDAKAKQQEEMLRRRKWKNKESSRRDRSNILRDRQGNNTKGTRMSRQRTDGRSTRKRPAKPVIGDEYLELTPNLDEAIRKAKHKSSVSGRSRHDRRSPDSSDDDHERDFVNDAGFEQNVKPSPRRKERKPTELLNEYTSVPERSEKAHGGRYSRDRHDRDRYESNARDNQYYDDGDGSEMAKESTVGSDSDSFSDDDDRISKKKSSGSNRENEIPKKKLRKKVADMSVEDVSNWMLSIGPAYKDYCGEIVENGIAGDSFSFLTEAETLEELGIKKHLHKKIVAKKATELLKNGWWIQG